MKVSFILPLFLLLGVSIRSSTLMAQSPGTFTRTGNMTTSRDGHTATLLPNGKILITGGIRDISSSGPGLVVGTAELYDPSTGAFTATGNMTTHRGYHTATLLPDGRVLIAGGVDPVYSASAELY